MTESEKVNLCKFTPNLSFKQRCEVVNATEKCLAGSYLAWRKYVFCTHNEDIALDFTQISTIVLGVLFLFLLLLLLSTSADDFLCPNVATIVNQLSISENIAGVTLMALGNGAPDIFSAIASVAGEGQAQEDLAFGTLLGGAIFVTTLVTASIMITRPFKAALWSTLRDLVFLMVTVGLFLKFFIDEKVALWQPLTCFLLYIIYVCTVFAFEYYKVEIRNRKSTTQGVSGGNVAGEASTTETGISTKGQSTRVAVSVSSVLGAGHENAIVVNSLENESDDGSFIITHSQMRSSLRSRQYADKSVCGQKGIVAELLSVFAPDFGEDEPSRLQVVKTLILLPVVSLFKLTVPLSIAPWSKPMAIIHSIVSPLCFLACCQIFFITWFPLIAVAPILSILLIVFIQLATTTNEEPRHYKTVYSFSGFVLSIGWIYAISTEVVEVITMIGAVTYISETILGLTILAWANSVGDLIADRSIARQGYCRMAMAAALGGPLFNLLIGFALPFTIAYCRKGEPSDISLEAVDITMIAFLFGSLLFTALNLLIFRAQLKRFHGYILLVIYAAFVIIVFISPYIFSQKSPAKSTSH